MAETMELAVINAAIDGIEAKVRAIPLDGSTAAGRDEIRSTAYKVARTKTALDALTEGWRTATGQVNAERKRAQERLDALADEVRAPLTEFENREKVRVAGHQSALAEIAAILSPLHTHTTVPEIEAALAELAALHIGRQWDEFVDVAKERLVREREERLKAEAAEKARLEAAEELKAAQEKAQRDAKAASDAAVAKERERAERQRKAREQARPIEILAALKAVCDGYTYDPGSSDLDDKQPIDVRMTLGDYRRASRLRHELEGK